MDNLNYHHLYYFWMVGREGSFTKASLKLRIAQSAVSSQVASLEAFLGKRLITRSTSKKFALTEEGQLVFSQAEEIFRQGRELVDGIKQGGLHSLVRFGAIGSLSKNLQMRLLKPLLQNPELELSVDVGDPTTLLDRLHHFHLDAILCDVPFPHSEDEPLIQREIAKERFCLISKNRKGSLPLHRMIQNQNLYLPAKSNPATQEIEGFLKAQKIRYLVRGYIDDIALLRLLALETDSLVVLPRVGAERELRTKELFVAHEFKTLYQRFYLVMRSKGSRTGRLLKLLSS